MKYRVLKDNLSFQGTQSYSTVTDLARLRG
jgi:hypothetical protein